MSLRLSCSIGINILNISFLLQSFSAQQSGCTRLLSFLVRYKVFPSLLTSAYSSSGIFTLFKNLPPHPSTDAIPEDLQSAVFELASNNLICSVALTGVLGLQAGRFWAESADDDDEIESLKATPGPSRPKTPQSE